MSSSGEASDVGQIVHVIQPTSDSGASNVTSESKDMPSHMGGVFYPMGVATHPVGGVSGPSCPQEESQQHPGSASSSEQFTVEEQVTTVRIPMRRPTPSFLEILQEGGARGEVFTMKEIVHHVKNYIIKHQLFDPFDPRVVHCRNDKLGHIFQVEKFTVNDAVPLFTRNTFPVPDSCIRIRRQLVKKALDSPGAASSVGVNQQSGSSVTSTVTSTTGTEGTSTCGVRQGEGQISTDCRVLPSSSHINVEKSVTDEAGPSENRRTSVNIEYGDEVDGAMPMMFQVNLETNDQPSRLTLGQAPEEDSFSVTYDSDHFAVEYELEPSDHRSESEHSSHDSAKPDYVVVQKESDVEFWADYSDTETNSDGELGDADQWLCEMCQTRNVPFYRNCSKCWTLRPHWLPDINLPSSTSSATLPAEPCGSQHGYHDASESNDEQLISSQGSLRHWRVGDRVRRRRIRVVSASSSEHNSESLVSLSDDEAPSTSTGGKDDSRTSSAVPLSSQEVSNSQETEGQDSLSQSQQGEGASGQNGRHQGGGKWGSHTRDGDRVAVSADVCMVCATRPKTGCIIHGSSGHQVCCYRCAKRLKRKGHPCPVCRRPIQKVIKNFLL